MATKQDHSSFSNKNDDNSGDQSQYSNLNLNQNYKCLKNNTVETKENFKIKGTANQISFDDSPRIKNATSWNKNGGGSSKGFEKHFEGLAGNKKKWQNDEDSPVDEKVVSSLSLHIAAYENAIEVADSEKPKETLHGRSKKDGLNEMKFKKYCGENDPNLFEFPRGNDKNDPKKHEVMAFKASQKLLKPNDRPSRENKENIPPPSNIPIVPPSTKKAPPPSTNIPNIPPPSNNATMTTATAAANNVSIIFTYPQICHLKFC
uniref:Uncharacterized protein n=1 Tax=Panagrolaimus superbus TaxID=310955 RepID=A0A914Z0R8_9BILA